MAWLEIAPDGGEFADAERFPVFIRETDGVGVYGVPHARRRVLKIARHHGGELTDPESIRRSQRWPTSISCGPSRPPICGRDHSRHEDRGLHVHQHARREFRHRRASRRSANRRDQRLLRHGFKFAPVIGDIAADLVSDAAPTGTFALSCRDFRRYRHTARA